MAQVQSPVVPVATFKVVFTVLSQMKDYTFPMLDLNMYKLQLSIP